MDRLSNLPNHILSDILSFVPFKEAAKTSTLSKHWHHQWQSTRNLDFNHLYFANRDSNGDVQLQPQIFIDFVQQFVANNKSPIIDKMSLTFSQPGDFQEMVEKCITFSVDRKVKHLKLDFSDPTWDENDLDGLAHPMFDLPQSFYNHQVLESVTLFSCKFDVFGFKNFGLLKSISLGWIELKVSTVKALLANCACLESLSVKSCWDMDSLSVCGKDLKLSSLLVEKCHFLDPSFEIGAPNLKYMKYCGTVVLFTVNGTSLEEADLDFGPEFECDESLGDSLYQSLNGICPTRALTVCTYMLQVIPMGEEPTGMEPRLNVTHLTLRTAMHNYEQGGIRFFLNSCPRLETLTIDIDRSRRICNEYRPPFEDKFEDLWRSSAIIFRCITQTLRKVEIKGFKGTPNEVYIMLYLVNHARVMEKLTVITSSEESNNRGPETFRSIAEQVYGFRKASENLAIEIV
ncbi:putative F-box protein At3g29830 [Pyrus x bretschneideri]|uniref:putative F-box protein At3g29830 n=1 Tax=Pyrus x bretschneideri TaxID=225117 RepID=UPI0020307868|nr:putative F-box protein At3g29830 [Pyrus x bretschneideri]